MQVAGKSNNNNTKILSIQLQLGGLSFYCAEEGKYIFRQMRDDNKQLSISQIISNEILLDNYDFINLFVNSLDYVMIPIALFDENMCEAYLQAKSIEVKEGDVIKYSLRDDVAYISLMSQGILPSIDFDMDIFPLIAKLYTFTKSYNKNAICFVILDSILHLCCSLGKQIILCESYPIVSNSDVEFYLSMVRAKYYANKKSELVLLYNDGNFAFEPSVIKKLKAKNIVKESFLEL